MADVIAAPTSGQNIIVGTATPTNIIVTGTNYGLPGKDGSSSTPGPGVAAGGTTGQILAKNSNTNYDTKWIDAPTVVAPTTTTTTTTAAATAASYLARTITQTAHGLLIGQVVYFDGNKFVKSQADSLENAEVTGIVHSVTSTDVFVLCTEGHVRNLTGFNPGRLYYLSPTTAGTLTTTEPSTAGQVSKPVFTADATSSGYFHNYRGILIV